MYCAKLLVCEMYTHLPWLPLCHLRDELQLLIRHQAELLELEIQSVLDLFVCCV